MAHRKVIVSIILLAIFAASIGAVAFNNTAHAQTDEERLWNWVKNQKCLCHEGTLKIALPEEPNTFNWWIASSSWSIEVLSFVYDHLVRWVNGTLVHELATDLSYSPDHKVLTIKVRQGVKWHDGQPLTAEDVAFTINMLAQKPYMYYHGYFTSVDHAEATDKYTVKVYFKEPDAGFIATALASMNVMPKHIWEPIIKKEGDKFAKYAPKIPDDLVGSGPFKIVEYKPTQYVKYVANENYWVEGKPCIKELIVVFIKESNVALLAVEKGNVDIYDGWVTAESVPKLLATPGVSIHVYISPYFYHWGMLNTRWPFNITDFRRAMAFAVDKQTIINTLLLGYGMPGSPGVVPPVGPNAYYYNPNVANAYYFDLNMTAKILDQLGFKDVDNDGWREAPNGKDFSFEIYPPSYDIVRVRAAQMIADWLSKVPGGGIKAVVRVLDWKTVWPLIHDGKVDSYLLGSGWANDISWLYRRFHSRPEGTGNWARYSNPEVDKLTEQLRTTFDPEKRKELAWKIQEYLAKEAPIVTLYYRKMINPYRTDKFDGFFKPADDGLVNRWTILGIHLKAEKCSTLPTSVVTSTVSSVTTITSTLPGGGTTTVVSTVSSVQTKTTTLVTTSVVTKSAGVSTGTIAAIAIIIIIIVAIGVYLARKK